MRIVRRPWIGQPPGLAPLSRELGGDALVWTATERQIIRGRSDWLATGEGSFNGIEGTGLGRAASWGAASGAGSDFGLLQPLPFTPADGFTIAVVAAPTAAAVRRVAVSFRKGSASVEQINLMFNTGATIAAASGAVTMYSRNTDAGVSAVTSTSGGIDSGLHCWVAGNSDASGYIYRDGEALTLATSTRPSGTLVSTAQKLRFGNLADYTTDGTFVHINPLLLVIVWPRLLPAAEAAEWSRRLVRNIGEAFEPQRVFVPVAAGASLALSAPTLSIAGAVTASGDIQIGVGLDVVASPLAVSGAVSVAGDLAYLVPSLDLSVTALSLAGSVVAAGDIQIGTSFDLSASTLSVAGAATVSGDIEISSAPTLDLAASALSVAGVVSLAGDLAYGSSFDLSSGTVAVAGAVSVSGDLLALTALDLSAATLSIAGALSPSGALAYAVAAAPTPAPSPPLVPAVTRVTASIQKEFVPLVNMTMQGGKSVPLYITKEWRRPLEQMAQLVNDQQLAIEALQARLTAGGL